MKIFAEDAASLTVEIGAPFGANMARSLIIEPPNGEASSFAFDCTACYAAGTNCCTYATQQGPTACDDSGGPTWQLKGSKSCAPHTRLGCVPVRP